MKLVWDEILWLADVDTPLIIEIFLPEERIQVYLPDNDGYFKRKRFFSDEMVFVSGCDVFFLCKRV
jgi:hypothetical protein